MNYLTFIIKSALFDFSRNKVRTFLTSLGILIGVLSVVLLIAFGLGLKKFIQDQFDSLGSNLLRVLPGQVLKGGSFSGGGGGLSGVRFDEKDILRLQRINDLQYVVPIFTKTVTVTAGGNNESGTLYSTSADIFKATNLNTEFGSVFTKNEVDKRTKVAVIGPKIAEKLFTTADAAIDRSIKFESQSFKVIGVMEKKGGGGFGGPDLDSFVYIPYKTGFIFDPDKKFFAIVIKARGTTDADIASAKEQVKEAMLKRYKEDEFSVLEQTEIIGAINSIFNMLNLVLVAIAAISLVVGGIGIMNIMYVTVTEKTKEIGIRRALGARKKDIWMQFLAQALILSSIGGLVGLALAFLITAVIQRFFPAYIDAASVALALGVSSVIGVIFGVFPAKKAADLSPIDAIRYE